METIPQACSSSASPLPTHQNPSVDPSLLLQGILGGFSRTRRRLLVLLRRGTLRLIWVLIQLLYCKVAQISDAAVHIFILQTGTHRINLGTIDV